MSPPRWRACARCAAAEARYRALVEQLPAVTYLHDLAGERRLHQPSDRAAGGDDARSSGTTDWEQAIHPDDRDRVRDLYQRHLRPAGTIRRRVPRADARRPRDLDQRARGGDARRRRRRPLPAGHHVRRDRPEAGRAGSAASRSGGSARCWRAASLAAVVTEQDGTVSFCNDCFAAMVGYRRDEIIGRSWVELFTRPTTRSTGCSSRSCARAGCSRR